MKNIVATAIHLISLLISSCGADTSNCMESCAHSFLKTHNKCEMMYERIYAENITCSDQAFAETRRCEARCYGNL